MLKFTISHPAFQQTQQNCGPWRPRLVFSKDCRLCFASVLPKIVTLSQCLNKLCRTRRFLSGWAWLILSFRCELLERWSAPEGVPIAAQPWSRLVSPSLRGAARREFGLARGSPEKSYLLFCCCYISQRIFLSLKYFYAPKNLNAVEIFFFFKKKVN